VLAHMQARLGPMEAGRFHGWAQLIADGVKFIQKEDITPTAADKWVFVMAPILVVVPVILIFIVIPFGPGGWWAENLDLGLFFVRDQRDRRHRHVDGRLGEREQVLPDRRDPRRRAADRLRVAARAR